MSDIAVVREGWDFMANVMGGDYSSSFAANEFKTVTDTNIHIKQINDSIDQLSASINNHPYKNLGAKQFKGYVAEEWHAGTFNIDAIKDGSSHRAETLWSHEYGSVDIDTNFGKQYSSKYRNTPTQTAADQAMFDHASGKSKYFGQERLVPKNQLEQAKDAALRRTGNTDRPEVSAAYEEARGHMVDKISDGKGHNSKPLTTNEATDIAKEAKSKEGFNPSKHGLEKLDKVQIDYVKSGIKAGATAAAITALMQLAPEIYKGIDYLIKNGEINLGQLDSAGTKIITTSGESFLRGTTAYAVEQAIQHGVLGEALKELSPTIVGVAVVIVMNTIRNSILVAAGKKTAAQMGAEFADMTIMSAGYLAGAKIGGAIAQSINPQLPGLAYLLGTLVGCAVSAVYYIGKKRLISLCVDTGFTCFGLVDQNYELPDSILNSLGIDTIEIPNTKINNIQINTISVHGDIKRTKPETIQITQVKRGVIGVNKIGYIPA